MTAPIKQHAESTAVRIATIEGGITTIGINRPQRRNAINFPTAKRLYDAFLAFENDPRQKICILHGTGGTFSAGFDLSQLAGWDAQTEGSRSKEGNGNQKQDKAVGGITRSKFEPVRDRNAGPLGPSRMQVTKPVICAVSGHCVAGGMELSLIADMRIVEEDVIFGIFSRRFGIPLLDGGTVRLQSIVGLGRALDIILTGRPVGAHEALHMGLANRVVPKGQAFDEAMKLARLLASVPQECLNADRNSCYYAAYQAQSLEDALSYEYNGAVRVADLGIREGLRCYDGINIPSDSFDAVLTLAFVFVVLHSASASKWSRLMSLLRINLGPLGLEQRLAPERKFPPKGEISVELNITRSNCPGCLVPDIRARPRSILHDRNTLDIPGPKVNISINQAKMPATIRVIGSLNADMVTVTPRFPGPGETLTASSFTTSAGGKGANQAVACGRLSRPDPRSSSASPDETAPPIHIEMIGAVGGLDAHFPTLLQPTLERSGVDISRIRQIRDAHTGVAVIIVDSSADGENRILFSPGANYAGMQPTAEVLDLALAGRPRPDVLVVQAEIPLETVIAVLRGVGRQRKEEEEENEQGAGMMEVVFNPAPAPEGGLPVDVYGAIDHLIMNETECEIMAPGELRGIPEVEERRRQIARYFHGLGVRYVVVTLGAQGVWYSAGDAGGKAQEDAQGWIRCVNQVPAAKVDKVVDTTGAGDTFVGGYAVQIARWREQRRAAGKGIDDMTDDERRERYHKGIEEAIRWAVRASAQCVQRQGAMDSIPWQNEI
ncbi:enoyl-CoA hydratase/carnithine racemase [Uncinocarpus reesii 1704]|uniref:Ribokinase n=1 Tax=Uncinocarpus reesii (strain UAMH 1704) TaxID=336963 RepID=C4JM99_UNCRE|nr:enoyl-CoA hydratase/carnithine racemase [Uncinocarpus reesii 1704]EEP79111.1 enoyl-CoA hydratase/carnithine racemase [Uncinocarpus reesii 1704]